MVVILAIVIVAVAADADEARGRVRIAALVPCDLWMSAERPRELDRGSGDVVCGELRRDELARRLSMLDPALDRGLDVVQIISHQRLLPRALSDHPRAGTARAVPHPRDHEQAIEVLRLLQTTVRPNDLRVPLRAVGRLQRLVLPPVILDDLDATLPRFSEVAVDGIAGRADLEVRIGHVAIEVELAVVPVRIFEGEVAEITG